MISLSFALVRPLIAIIMMNDSDPAIIVDNKAIDGDFYLLIGLFSLTLDHQLNHRSIDRYI